MDIWNRVWGVCLNELQHVSFRYFVICSLVGAALVHVGCLIYVRVKRQAIHLSTEFVIILLISYLVFIAQITVLDRKLESGARIFDTKGLWINKSMKQNLTNLLNVLLYVPLGILLAGLQLRKHRIIRILITICFCFLISLLLESTQYISNRGYFEVDDIEANMLGGLTGCIFLSMCSRAVRLFSMIRRCDHGKET